MSSKSSLSFADAPIEIGEEVWSTASLVEEGEFMSSNLRLFHDLPPDKEGAPENQDPHDLISASL